MPDMFEPINPKGCAWVLIFLVIAFIAISILVDVLT